MIVELASDSIVSNVLMGLLLWKLSKDIGIIYLKKACVVKLSKSTIGFVSLLLHLLLIKTFLIR